MSAAWRIAARARGRSPRNGARPAAVRGGVTRQSNARRSTAGGRPGGPGGGGAGGAGPRGAGGGGRAPGGGGRGGGGVRAADGAGQRNRGDGAWHPGQGDRRCDVRGGGHGDGERDPHEQARGGARGDMPLPSTKKHPTPLGSELVIEGGVTPLSAAPS